MKKIILLKHDSLNHDSKILGLFYADDIVNIIKYYSHLPGFSSNTSGFDISKSICSNNNFAFLLQIWNKNDDEEVILEATTKLVTSTTKKNTMPFIKAGKTS